MTNKLGDRRRPTLQRRLLQTAQAGLGWTGAAGWYARRQGSCPPIILMYHSVAREPAAGTIALGNRMGPDRFERQMRFLADRRRVVGIEQFLDLIDRRGPIPAGTVVLTFDDGYLDNLEVVAPILARYRLPAVIYLCTGYVSRGENQWADTLYWAIRFRSRDRLTIDGVGSFDLSGPQQQQAAYKALCDRLLPARLRARREVLDRVTDQLQPKDKPGRQVMSWQEASRLVSEFPNITLGVHTADHLDLSSLSVDDAVAEVKRSVDEFESRLGRRPEHFSFPYSRAVPGVCSRLDGLGIRSAMTTVGVCDPGSLDPFDLQRLEAPASQSLLNYWTSGAHPGLSKALFWRE